MQRTQSRPGIATSVPPTPAEAAAMSTSWERRGPLARLVRPERRGGPSGGR